MKERKIKMLNEATFKMKSLDKELLTKIISKLENAGLSFDIKWQKLKKFKLKPYEKNSILQLKINDIAFLIASLSSVTIKTKELTIEQDAIISKMAKECWEIKNPSFVIPITLSILHLLLLIVVAVSIFSSYRVSTESGLIGINCIVSSTLLIFGLLTAYQPIDFC